MTLSLNLKVFSQKHNVHNAASITTFNSTPCKSHNPTNVSDIYDACDFKTAVPLSLWNARVFFGTNRVYSGQKISRPVPFSIERYIETCP